ncbi:MAG: outer membrane protein assembly factor BamE [Desulfobacteraceae bacterium]|nr:outer membrane protein assembly factor BamE [Desulfobacteraceae bacterium]
MVRFKDVLIAVFSSIIIVCLVCATGCSRDQSSSTQQPAASSQASAPAPAPAQAPPAAPMQAPAPAPAPMPQQAMTAAPVGPQSVNQIQVGMTSQQVLQIMGSPARVEQERGMVEWKYYFPQGGKFEVYLQNDKVVSMKSKSH